MGLGGGVWEGGVREVTVVNAGAVAGEVEAIVQRQRLGPRPPPEPGTPPWGEGHRWVTPPLPHRGGVLGGWGCPPPSQGMGCWGGGGPRHLDVSTHGVWGAGGWGWVSPTPGEGCWAGWVGLGGRGPTLGTEADVGGAEGGHHAAPARGVVKHGAAPGWVWSGGGVSEDTPPPSGHAQYGLHPRHVTAPLRHTPPTKLVFSDSTQPGHAHSQAPPTNIPHPPH